MQGILVADLALFVEVEKGLVKGDHNVLAGFFINAFSLDTSPLRIRSEARGVLSRSSITARRPLPSWRGHSIWATKPFRLSEKSVWSC